MGGNRGQYTLSTIRCINEELIATVSLIHREAMPTKSEIEPRTNDAVSQKACDLDAGQSLQVVAQIMPKPHLRERCKHGAVGLHANDPAQAGRANDVRMLTQTRSRPCLEPEC